ncbi:endothelin-converting enzyme 1-like [Actinia tenebrosa]|uniref:Endothelin-converting enzyme 1-like n=1 Tax=Actinia tenebrosa TaxID=6105 RepID=A0A6P8HDV5_ACTTE|nr:endothelin-converting enzyme 1-like [Actinia tenebrosa]
MADLKYELTKQEDNVGNDVMVSSSEKQPRLKPKQKTCAIIVVGVLVFIILLLLIGIIVIGVALHKARQKQPSPCLTLDCINAVSDVARSVDNSVDPCNDFYQYACGKWSQNNPTHESKSSWDPISQRAFQNQEKIKHLIVGKETRGRYYQKEAFRKIFDLYDSCVDDNTMSELGGKPLKDLMDSLSSSPGLNSSWNEGSWDFNSVILEINRNYTPFVFFKLWVQPLEANSSVNGIFMQSGGMSLASSRYNSNHTRNVEIKNAYKAHMMRLFKLLGLNQNQSQEMMESAFSVETKIAELSRNVPDALKEEVLTIKEMDKDEEKTKINWLEFFTKLFEDTDFKPTESTQIALQSRTFFKSLNRYLYNASKSDLANYMMWRLINHYSSILSKPFRQSLPTFYKVFRGTVPEVPRWETCLMEVKSYFGMAIGRMFVEEVFRNGSKAEVTEMVENIKEVFIQDFDQVDWMDSKTRAVAKEKAKAMDEHVGYPEFIMDDSKLADLYKKMDVRNDTYFRNYLSIDKIDKKKTFEKMGNPVNKESWEMSPTTVNALYKSTSNSIDIPAGILQKPFFSETYTNSLNFGGIGSIIGHEMTHGFDNLGRTYNQKGNLKKWWSNSSIENFERLAKCFVDQYSNFTYEGTNLNGETVLGEVIADNGGVEISFKAYKLWVKAHGQEPMLPGINLSHEQMFFLSYAQIFCASYSKGSAARMISYARHPINPLRVKGVMVNSHEFSRAYNCPVGSPMNPAKKCKIW